MKFLELSFLSLFTLSQVLQGKDLDDTYSDVSLRNLRSLNEHSTQVMEYGHSNRDNKRLKRIRTQNMNYKTMDNNNKRTTRSEIIKKNVKHIKSVKNRVASKGSSRKKRKSFERIGKLKKKKWGALTDKVNNEYAPEEIEEFEVRFVNPTKVPVKTNKAGIESANRIHPTVNYTFETTGKGENNKTDETNINGTNEELPKIAKKDENTVEKPDTQKEENERKRTQIYWHNRENEVNEESEPETLETEEEWDVRKPGKKSDKNGQSTTTPKTSNKPKGRRKCVLLDGVTGIFSLFFDGLRRGTSMLRIGTGRNKSRWVTTAPTTERKVQVKVTTFKPRVVIVVDPKGSANIRTKSRDRTARKVSSKHKRPSKFAIRRFADVFE